MGYLVLYFVALFAYISKWVLEDVKTLINYQNSTMPQNHQNTTKDQRQNTQETISHW